MWDEREEAERWMRQAEQAVAWAAQFLRLALARLGPRPS